MVHASTATIVTVKEGGVISLRAAGPLQKKMVHKELLRALDIRALLCRLSKTVTASVVFYITSLSFTKISILLLYRRIFPNRNFHAVLWAVGGFVTAYTVANVLYIIFGCHPIQAVFNPLTKGKCINGEAAILAVATMTIVTDFIILLLPLPLVWKLHLPKIRKFQLTLIFLLGIFAIVASIYRATQIRIGSKVDLSYDSTNRAIWSGVEICTAIVCANLAILRPVLKFLFTRTGLTAATPGTSRGTAGGTGSGWRHRWLRWTAAPAASEASKDGRFHRLEHHPGPLSSDDLERQKYEGIIMPALTSPVKSPQMPETTHF
ncbi:MAG: hypothetical protein LQ346_003233 [Caloplaca aetnensis]|nr:MAG: hypothetical protein LQ346_003233 [Caloplaca aetnensis]